MGVQTHINPAGILASRGLGSDNRARRYLASQVQRLSDPYVPKNEGWLKNEYTISSDGRTLTYEMPYAKRQYYTNKGGRNGPLRGSYWTMRMLADNRKALEKSLKDYIGGK